MPFFSFLGPLLERFSLSILELIRIAQFLFCIITAEKYTHRWGFVIQAAGLVYEERSWPNDMSPHEAPNKEINPGFTPGSGETLFRLSPHTHMQKVCHALFFFPSYATGFL